MSVPDVSVQQRVGRTLSLQAIELLLVIFCSLVYVKLSLRPDRINYKIVIIKH